MVRRVLWIERFINFTILIKGSRMVPISLNLAAVALNLAAAEFNLAAAAGLLENENRKRKR